MWLSIVHRQAHLLLADQLFNAGILQNTLCKDVGNNCKFDGGGVGSGTFQASQATAAAADPPRPVLMDPNDSKADGDAGWQEVTRQSKKQAQLAAAAEAAAAAAANVPRAPHAAMHDPGSAEEVPLVHPSPKFCQCSIRMTPFPGQWSHLQARQACQGYAAHYGQVLVAWTGLSNSGRLYGAVRFATPGCAKRMMTAYRTKGIPGAPKNLLFIDWQGKVPANLLKGEISSAAALIKLAQLPCSIHAWHNFLALHAIVRNAWHPDSIHAGQKFLSGSKAGITKSAL